MSPCESTLESFISLIRFIVVAAMANGDLALLEFVYRSDRVSQRNGRKRGEGELGTKKRFMDKLD